YSPSRRLRTNISERNTNRPSPLKVVIEERGSTPEKLSQKLSDILETRETALVISREASTSVNIIREMSPRASSIWKLETLAPKYCAAMSSSWCASSKITAL